MYVIRETDWHYRYAMIAVQYRHWNVKDNLCGYFWQVAQGMAKISVLCAMLATYVVLMGLGLAVFFYDPSAVLMGAEAPAAGLMVSAAFLALTGTILVASVVVVVLAGFWVGKVCEDLADMLAKWRARKSGQTRRQRRPSIFQQRWQDWRARVCTRLELPRSEID